MSDPAVITPYGVYCLPCARESGVGEEVYTIYEDAQLDDYPVCERCGRRHEYMDLTPLGERYELEVRGPKPCDVMLTECGPADKLLELSVVEDEVVAVFPPHRLDTLADLVADYRDDHPDANVWVTRRDGTVELAPADLYAGDPQTASLFVNRRA